MTNKDWEKEFDSAIQLWGNRSRRIDANDLEALKDFIESLLEQARREVIESIPESIDGDYDLPEWLKQQLISKYLTPIGNLDK